MQSIKASQDWFMQKFPTIFADRLTWGLRFAPSPEECSSSLKEAFEELTRTVGLPKEEKFILKELKEPAGSLLPLWTQTTYVCPFV